MNAEPGELVFEENWDDFNMDIWEHEMTMNGGGNWEFQFSVKTINFFQRLINKRTWNFKNWPQI